MAHHQQPAMNPPPIHQGNPQGIQQNVPMMMYQPGIQIHTISSAQPVPGSAIPGQVTSMPAQNNTIVIGATQPPQLNYQQNVFQYENYKHITARYLAITQIVVGCLAFLFQIIAIVVSAGASSTSPGIWGGILVSVM